MKTSTFVAAVTLVIVLLALSFQSRAFDILDQGGNVIDDSGIAQYCFRVGPGFPPLTEGVICVHRNFWLEVKGCTLGPEETRKCSDYFFVDQIIIDD